MSNVETRPRITRVPWLRTDRLLGEHGIARDGVGDRREFARRMEAQRLEPDASDGARHDALRRGWRLGAEDFLARILDLVQRPAATGHGRSLHEETEQAIARRIVEEELKAAGLGLTNLATRRKGDAIKVRIGARLRDETTLTLRQIAELLHMGAATHVAHLLYHSRRSEL